MAVAELSEQVSDPSVEGMNRVNSRNGTETIEVDSPIDTRGPFEIDANYLLKLFKTDERIESPDEDAGKYIYGIWMMAHARAAEDKGRFVAWVTGMELSVDPPSYMPDEFAEQISLRGTPARSPFGTFESHEGSITLSASVEAEVSGITGSVGMSQTYPIEKSEVTGETVGNNENSYRVRYETERQKHDRDDRLQVQGLVLFASDDEIPGVSATLDDLALTAVESSFDGYGEYEDFT